MTRQQRTVLAALSARPMNGSELARALAKAGIETTTAGAHQTAASLVRRGLVQKAYPLGLVEYELTPAGQAVALAGMRGRGS